jgi:hypothetical protein
MYNLIYQISFFPDVTLLILLAPWLHVRGPDMTAKFYHAIFRFEWGSITIGIHTVKKILCAGFHNFFELIFINK